MMVRALELFLLALQFSVGMVFLFSAVPKLRHPMEFVRTTDEYKILPSQLAYLFGLTLIPLEILVAISFLTGWMIHFALLIALVLLLIFVIAVGINIRRGRQIACGCFGNSTEQISKRTLMRLFMLLVAILILLGFQNLGVVVPTFSSLITLNGNFFLYVAQVSILSASFIVLGDWLLNLPEALRFIRYASRNPE